MRLLHPVGGRNDKKRAASVELASRLLQLFKLRNDKIRGQEPRVSRLPRRVFSTARNDKPRARTVWQVAVSEAV